MTMIAQLSLFTLPLLIATTNCQFAMDELKPDISFGEQNDRFDISSMIRKQNRLFREHPEEYRRQGNRDDHQTDDARFKDLEAAFNAIKFKLDHGGRRIDDGNDANFAYHDEMYSKEGDGGATDFEVNLKQFQRARPSNDDFRRVLKYMDSLHGGKSRRAGDPESEILMHYAVPIDIKVKGYLQAPLA